jgi:hypothetical protein
MFSLHVMCARSDVYLQVSIFEDTHISPVCPRIETFGTMKSA